MRLLNREAPKWGGSLWISLSAFGAAPGSGCLTTHLNSWHCKQGKCRRLTDFVNRAEVDLAPRILWRNGRGAIVELSGGLLGTKSTYHQQNVVECFWTMREESEFRPWYSFYAEALSKLDENMGLVEGEEGSEWLGELKLGKQGPWRITLGGNRDALCSYRSRLIWPLSESHYMSMVEWTLGWSECDSSQRWLEMLAIWDSAGFKVSLLCGKRSLNWEGIQPVGKILNGDLQQSQPQARGSVGWWFQRSLWSMTKKVTKIAFRIS